MTSRIDISGQRFGRLVALRRAGKKGSNWLWYCRCDCGGKKVSTAAILRFGRLNSCGCLVRETSAALCRKRATHGHSRVSGYSPTYLTWMSMRQRCNYRRHVAWARYGGAGIKICERWNSFENFLADMGPRPPGTTLDRIDNSGDYEPKNCRWATRMQQGDNQRTVRRLEANGRKLSIAQWSRETGLRTITIQARLRRGWSVERAVSEPARPHHRKR